MEFQYAQGKLPVLSIVLKPYSPGSLHITGKALRCQLTRKVEIELEENKNLPHFKSEIKSSIDHGEF